MPAKTPLDAVASTMPPLDQLKPVSSFTGRMGVNRSTLFRWVTRGVKPGNIRLKAWLLKEWCTTEEYVNEFIQARTAAKLKLATNTVPTSPAIAKNAAATKAALKRAGFKVSPR